MIVAAILLAVCVALVVHECGHAVVASVLRLPWTPVLTRHGPGMRIGSDAITLTRRQVAMTCAGGPAANVLLAVLAIRFGFGLLALVNLEFAVANLIPFRRSDGHRILFGQ